MGTISFFLMTYKGLSVLKTVAEELGEEFIDKVITSHDQNVHNDYCTEIQDFCRERKIDVYLKEDNPEIKTSYAFAVSWRWLIPVDNRYKLIVLHDSLLPKKRGFNPLVTSLINGDKEIGVTALFSTQKYDSGPVIDQENFSVTYPCKIQDAIEIISKGYANLVTKICLKIKRGETINVAEQDESKATFSLWRDDEDYKIDWHLTSEEIERFINAVGYPYAGAFTSIDGQLIRIVDVESYPDKIIENRVPGKLIFFEEKDPVIVCGKGLLRIKLMLTETGEIFSLKKFRTRFK